MAVHGWGGDLGFLGGGDWYCLNVQWKDVAGLRAECYRLPQPHWDWSLVIKEG